jgi:DNA-binding transcriptional LysR family regulator
MSHALTRLRHMLKDDMFVRSPMGMIPTPRAEELATPIRNALDGLQHALEPEQFDPSKTTATFRIAVDNYAAIVLVASVAVQVAKLAPKVTLDFRPSGTLHVLDLLDRSELHLAMGTFDLEGERFSAHRLLQDEFVLVHRKDHPDAAARNLSREDVARLPKLEISSASFETDTTQAETRKSKTRQIPAMRAPFLAAARILATSDLTAIVPLNVAKTMILPQQLVYNRLPRFPKPAALAMIWLRRLDNQPAHAWLRDLIARVTLDIKL